MFYATIHNSSKGKMKILTNVKYPSKQEGNVVYDSSEENLTFQKVTEDMPLSVKGFYSAVAFKASYILLSRDVIGGKPLYYSTNEFSSYRKLIDSNVKSVNPGEVVKVGYDGEINVKKYNFDDVFNPDPSEKDEGEIDNLLEFIEKNLKKFSYGECIAFSGGVDSSLLAALYDVPLISVTANEKEKEHIEWAAKKLCRDIEIFMFDEKTVEKILPEVVRGIEDANPFQVSIGIPVYLALKKAKEMGFNSIMFGQGADELFGGYKKYEQFVDSDNLFYVLKKDVENLGVNNLERDVKLAYKAEINLMTPYLQWDIIKAVMKIPGSYKVRKVNGEIIRKYALRKIAEKYLPKEIAYRDKKAVQYSTRTVKILEKIAKREGIKLSGLIGNYLNY